MSFYVGQKIVCVDAKIDRPEGMIIRGYATINNLDGLTEGQVYTIRSIRRCWESEIPGFFLEEIIRPLDFDGEEAPYRSTRFRPLVERQTDITVFQQILHRVSNKTPETVR